MDLKSNSLLVVAIVGAFVMVAAFSALVEEQLRMVLDGAENDKCQNDSSIPDVTQKRKKELTGGIGGICPIMGTGGGGAGIGASANN